MKKIILPIMAMLLALCAHGQYTLKAIIKDSLTNEPLLGSTASVMGTLNGGAAENEGKLVIKDIPRGKQTIVVRYIGYAQKEIELLFPLADTAVWIVIFMHRAGEDLEQVTISTTRTSRSIDDEPTRVEVIELEEIDEKANMKPANISMLLHESTGIQVQQTSATSANASIRIQGLDGRYTQLLKDGYPNFGNFASGLSILEIPPLDLKQVEIIKGPASTLYGGGAIAGVVNFISKTPNEKTEYNFLLNQSHIGQSNIGAFASQRGKKFGYTILGLGNYQKPYDVDDDDFTELPKSVDFTIHPKLFFYPSERTTIIVGNSFTKGDRKGGDLKVVNNEADSTHTYFEENNTVRNITTAEFRRKMKGTNVLSVRSSLSYFNREIQLPSYRFEGTNYNSYTDVSHVANYGNITSVSGVDFTYDGFKERPGSQLLKRDFSTYTGGAYLQATYENSRVVKVETGLRVDGMHYGNSKYNKTNWEYLIKSSLLARFSDKVSSRLGFGMGYKLPTMFTEQTEALQYRNVLPLDGVKPENSFGVTADINYKTPVTDDLYFSLNHMFFYTGISKSTVLNADTMGNLFFTNTDKHVSSVGFETNAKLIFKENFKLFAGYTFTYAKAGYLSGNRFITLTPRNKLNLALVYEKEKSIKMGLEGYFSDRQYLNNGLRSPSYWEFGAMVEKIFGKFSVYVNAENFTDTRQSKYKRVVNEPHNNPTFDDIWTHTEGLVISAGVKIRL